MQMLAHLCPVLIKWTGRVCAWPQTVCGAEQQRAADFAPAETRQMKRKFHLR